MSEIKETLQDAAIKWDAENFGWPTDKATVTMEETKTRQWNIDAFKAGANWQKEQDKEKFQRLIKLVEALVYYSQIHTVKGVRAANMDNHENTWREAQKWLWDNCDIIEGEYILKHKTIKQNAPDTN